MQHRLKMEGEVGSLSDSLTTAQRQLSEQKVHAKETANQVSSLRCSLELARQELVDYKQKAQRILQVSSLNASCSVGDYCLVALSLY